MALTTSEVSRLKYELGYPLLQAGAEPYIGTSAAFEQVIQPYLQAGASTTCATAVTASTTPAPVTLTLASATGFAAGNRIVVDVDDRQETPTVQLVNASTIVVLLSKTHSGTYPVTVEGGESMIREALDELRELHSSIKSAAIKAGIKRVDEIEFFEAKASDSSGVFGGLVLQRDYARDELASILGIANMRRNRRSAGARCAMY